MVWIRDSRHRDCIETQASRKKELTMGPIDAQDAETTINELILVLRENGNSSDTEQRETQILVAYALSGLFGSEGPCSHRWH